MWRFGSRVYRVRFSEDGSRLGGEGGRGMSG